MTNLLLTTILTATLAVTGTAFADETPVPVGEGEYGCCCPWAYAGGMCPVDFVTFWGKVDDVCVHVDDEGNIVGYCFDDPDGVYLFRGLSWPELAAFMSEYYGIEPTVGSMIDLFCGIDRTLPPGGE